MEQATAAPVPKRWRRRVESVSDAFGIVFLLVVVSYVLMSLLPLKGWTAVLVAAVSCLTAVVGLASARAPHPVVDGAAALSVVAVGLETVAAAAGGHGLYGAAALIIVSLLTLAMVAVLRRVITAERVGVRSILGALSVYVLLGLLFGYLYSAIDRLQAGQFFQEKAAPAGSDFLFFSYTTLTTTGYGNLVPGGQPGRMVAGLEMMIGQVFLVTLVAGLVSLWRPGEAIRRRRERREGEAGAPADSPGA
jgi:hypothetical protein